MSAAAPSVGAWLLDDGRARFRVWAPAARRVVLRLVDDERVLPCRAEGDGWWHVHVTGLGPGTRYGYELDGGPRMPDPASCAQPEGVHGPSALVRPVYEWRDASWQPPARTDLVCYELHVGTFTPTGTFVGVVGRLDELVDLGVNALELMPIAEFPGARNWGYDGVDLYAAHHAYGGLDGLRLLVDECHVRGVAVLLDVVYNHLGPDGNHLSSFGPYFTDRYRTPWGAALNLDGPGSDGVREFFVENARFWAAHAHVDGFRLDAVHAIADATASTFVEELTASLHSLGEQLGRSIIVIAESADNDPRLTAPVEGGGRGVDAQWNDDFHHALHVALTGERSGYYRDFEGATDLASAYAHGFVYRGQHSAVRGRRHGRADQDVPRERLVVFAQNHDHIGNRPGGERLTTLASFEQCKLAAAAVLLGPSIPLLFMGEEWAETKPFPYFTSHDDPELAAAVREGRRREHGDTDGFDPQDPATFGAAVLTGPRNDAEGLAMLALHRELIAARRDLDLGCPADPVTVSSDPDVATILVARSTTALVLTVGPETVTVRLPPGSWTARLDTAAEEWRGPGGHQRVDGSGVVDVSPWSAVLLVRR